MKKIFIFFLLLICSCLNCNEVLAAVVNQDCSVKGVRGAYRYDINEFYIMGGNLVITGWGLLGTADGHFEVHNIQPTFNLRVVATNNQKVIKDSKVFHNMKMRNGADVIARNDGCYYVEDYTRIMWHKPDEKTFYQLLSCFDRSSPDEGLAKGNFLYLDLDFKFEIPLTNIETLIKGDVERIYFQLTIKTESGNPIVFGNKVPTVKREETFYISIPNDIIDTKNLKLWKIFKGIENPTQKVTVITTTGITQTQSVLAKGHYYSGSGLELSAKAINYNGTKTYYKQGNGYTVKSTIISGAFASNETPKIRFYEVGIKRENERSVYVVDGGKYIAYIPALWVTPFCVPDTPSGIMIDTPCSENPACTPTPSTSCPTHCCEEICLNKPSNMQTAFCKACYPNEPPPTNGGTPKCDYDDALAQYCCLYPNDRELCDDLLERQIGHDNRSAGCARNSSVQEKYKYPQRPTIAKMGQAKVKYDKNGHTKSSSTNNNSACYIGCQEQLVINFEREPYVKAGMGITYPVGIKATRYCAAIYETEKWLKSMETAVKEAKRNYDLMKQYLQAAHNKSSNCGNKYNDWYTIDPHTPSCSYSYGCSHCSPSSCTPPSCSTCGPSHNYTNFSTYAFFEKNFNYNFKNKDLLVLNTSSPLLAEGEKCVCSSGTNTRNCPGLTCDEFKCSESWAYWDKAQEEIASDLAEARKYKNLHDRQIQIIAKLNSDRQVCDNWVRSNAYNTPQTNIKTTFSSQNSYVQTNNSYTSSDSSFLNKRKYNSNYDEYYCNMQKHEVSKSSYMHFATNSFDNPVYCISTYTSKTLLNDIWVEKSMRDLRYEFINQKYVQRYTGDIRTSAAPGYDYHGRYYYTDYFDNTGAYAYRLVLTNLGPNLTGSGTKVWTINPFSCRYNLTNWIFPPITDPQYGLYGSTTFRYRTISLLDPFPNRKAGSNWLNKENLIIKMDKNPLWINLTARMRDEIRYYNIDKKYNYASFNVMDPYRSDLIIITQGNLIRINEAR